MIPIRWIEHVTISSTGGINIYASYNDAEYFYIWKCECDKTPEQIKVAINTLEEYVNTWNKKLSETEKMLLNLGIEYDYS